MGQFDPVLIVYAICVSYLCYMAQNETRKQWRLMHRLRARLAGRAATIKRLMETVYDFAKTMEHIAHCEKKAAHKFYDPANTTFSEGRADAWIDAAQELRNRFE